MACGHSKSAPIIKTNFGTPVIIIFGLSGAGICFFGGCIAVSGVCLGVSRGFYKMFWWLGGEMCLWSNDN